MITTIMLLLTVSMYSQDCDYKTNELDKATGKFTKVTERKTVADGMSSGAKMATQKIGDECSVKWTYLAGFNMTKFFVNKDAELIFMLEDGSKVTLKRGVEKDNYPITKEQMDALLKSKTSAVQYYYTVLKTGEYGKESYLMEKKWAERIQDLIKCIY